MHAGNTVIAVKAPHERKILHGHVVAVEILHPRKFILLHNRSRGHDEHIGNRLLETAQAVRGQSLHTPVIRHQRRTPIPRVGFFVRAHNYGPVGVEDDAQLVIHNPRDTLAALKFAFAYHLRRAGKVIRIRYAHHRNKGFIPPHREIYRPIERNARPLQRETLHLRRVVIRNHDLGDELLAAHLLQNTARLDAHHHPRIRGYKRQGILRRAYVTEKECRHHGRARQNLLYDHTKSVIC